MASLKDLIVLGPARFLDKIYGNLEGNASSADKLKTARSISLSGAVKGSATFDGSGNVGIATTFAQGMNYAGSDSDGGAAKSALKLVNSSNQGLTIGSATEPVYFNNGVPVKANTIENAKSAEYLSPGAKINGTNFTGSTDITTTSWGTARNIYIADSDSSHTGAAVSINGSGNATLKLPSTIKATLMGNADSAYKLKSSVGLTGNSSNQNVFWNPFTWEINTAWGGCTGIYTLSDTENDFNGIFRVKFRNGNGAAVLSIKSVTWLSASASTPPVLTLTTTVNSESVTYKLYISSGTNTYRTYKISKISEEGTAPTTATAYTTSMTGTVQSTAEVIYASTTSKLATARNITISGTASSSVGTFDGGSNTTIYMPLTIQGFNEIKTKKLTITSTEGVSHIVFSRLNGLNYLHVPTTTTEGAIALCANENLAIANSSLIANRDSVYPGTTNVVNLGTSSYKWKGVYATTFYGALSGNATTATKLETARTINGTSFDGSGNITTSYWGTARTITIGSTSKSVNGSTNYSWTHAEIGATVSNAWTAGTTAGPKISTTVNGVTGTAVAIPSASASASGVVTTGNQRFSGVKTLEYPVITSNATRYQGYKYQSSSGTLVGEHWLDIGNATNVTQGQMFWRIYSAKTTADAGTTGYYETYSLPAVTIGRASSASYEIFTSKNYTTLDNRYVNVSGDTMTGDLKFTTKGIHFIPGNTDQYLWKVYSNTDGEYGFRLQYNGTGSGNNNSLSLIADNQTGTEINAITMLQDGTTVFTVNPQFKTTNFTSTPITLYDDTTTYGHTMLIGAGGTTYVGAGEAASGLYSKLGVKSTEDLILGADANIRFHTGADSATTTNGVTLDTTNAFYPQTNNTGSLGSSTKKWNKVYASIFKNGYLENYFTVDTSRALTLFNLYDSDNSTLHMHIGAHNTGNSTGSIYIIPYPKTKDAWSGEEGLYIAKNLLKLDNNRIPTTGNTTGTVGSTSKAVYVNAGVITEITTLAVSKGGTGTSTAPVQGGVIYASSTSAYASTAAGSSGQLLQSAGTGKPTWITATNSNTASTIVKRDSSGGFSAGAVTLSGILTLTKTTDAEATVDNGPALIVGGTRTTQHIEMDGNEIMSKSNGTTPATLYLNAGGGLVSVGSGGLSVSGGISTNNNITTTHASGGETSVRVTHGSSEYLYLWGNNSSGTRGLYDTTKGYVIQVTDTSTTFTGNVTGSSASCTGNAATATKLATARNIVLSGDLTGSASFNGTANATITTTNYKCSVNGGNTNSFPFHRIAYVTGKTGQWVDCDCILDIKHNYNGGGFGRVKISLRTNGTGTAISASAVWLYKYNIKDDAISVAYWGTTGQSCYADVFYNHEKTYPRCTVYQVYGGRVWTLVDSNQPNDGAAATEAYTSISAAATALHGGTAYTNIVESTQANSVGILPISGGGTGANTPTGALSNLGGVGYTVVTNLSSLL